MMIVTSWLYITVIITTLYNIKNIRVKDDKLIFIFKLRIKS